MASPPGMITNVGKMAIVGFIAAGTAEVGLHVLDKQFGHEGSPIDHHTSDGYDHQPSGEYVRNDPWRGLVRTSEVLLGLGAGATAVTGAAVAGYDISTAAKALGESPTSDAIRGGKIRGASETMLGLGIGAVGAVVAGAAIAHLTEQE